MEKTFIYLSIFSAVAPLISGATQFKKSFSSAKAIYLLVMCSFSADLLNTLSAYIFRSNYWGINVYWVIELTLVIIFFYLEIKRKWVISTGLVLLVLLVLNLSFSGFNTFQGNYRSFYSLVMIFLSLRVYYKIFKEAADIFIEGSFLFLANTGFFIYYSGSLFTMILGKEILTDPGLTWTLHNIANILKNIFFAIGLWKARAVS